MAILPSHKTSQSTGEPHTATREGLEGLRKRLLDLTRRNRLLNFRHSAKSCLRVVDELPDELFKHLRDDEKLIFTPVPQPEPEKNEHTPNGVPALPLFGEIPPREDTVQSPRKVMAKEHAAKLGINVSYDLPKPGHADNPRHFDKYIQTLHFPDELEAILRRISNSARTALEESGTNMLYLVFGFLEWYESSSSSEPLYAPLVALPVELTKNKPSRALGGMFEYCIEHTGEDLLTNLSLAERMKRDFALSIPVLENDDTPEGYFEKFQEILKTYPKWKIHRQITLTLLHFGKLLMFLDLDPARYPSLLSHTIVKQLLEGQPQREQLSYANVYELDEPAVAAELPPIIYDADSSQHSALIDALNGKNLVIEGPPGTGKSQTITNLIAAALVRGKTVLFISEKLAALEVVRRRLDQAGLGHFCLEVHSHKTKKDKFLQDIRERIQKQRSFRGPDDLQDKIRLLDRHRKELIEHVQLINRPFGALRKTIFDIIWRRDICLETHPFLEPLADRLTLSQADKLVPAEQEHQRLLVDIHEQHLALLMQSQPSVASHPWSGIRNITLTFIQEREVCEKVRQLKSCLDRLAADAKLFLAKIGMPLETSITALQRLCELRTVLPQPTASEYVSLLPRLRVSNSRDVVKQFMHLLTSWRKQDLLKGFSEPPAVESQVRDDLQNILCQILRLNLGGQTRRSLSDLTVYLQEVRENLTAVLALFEGARRLLGITYPCTLRTLPHLADVLALLKRTNFEILHLRNSTLGNPVYDERRNKAQAEGQTILRLKSQLSQDYIITRLPSSDELWKHATTVSSSTLFRRLFTAEYKAARNCYRSLRKHGGKVNWSTMASDLKELAEYQERIKTFTVDQHCQEAFGPIFHGLDTPFTKLAQLQDWYANLNSSLSRHGPSAQPLIDALHTLPLESLRLLNAQAQENAAIVELMQKVPAELDKLNFILQEAGSFYRDKGLDDLTEEIAQVAKFLGNACDLLTPIPFLGHVKVEDMPSLLEKATEFKKTEQMLNHDSAVSDLLGNYYHGCRTEQRGLESTMSLVETVCNDYVPSEIQTWLLENDYPERLRTLDEQLQSVNNQLSQVLFLWNDFTTFVDLDVCQWHAETKLDWKDLLLEILNARLDRAQSEPQALSAWLNYLRSRRELEDVHLTNIIMLAEQLLLEPGQLKSAYDFAVYNGLSNLILKAYPSLLNFSRGRHEKIRDEFVKLDNAILELYRKEAAYQISRRDVPAGNGIGPVRDYTDRALIEHEIQKQRGHIPIRSLLNRAPQALLGLKPCFMMGPMFRSSISRTWEV